MASVSRETHLSPGEALREYFSGVFENDTLSVDPALAPLVLFASHVKSGETRVVVCPDSNTAEAMYQTSYTFWPDRSCYYPETNANPDAVVGFDLAVDRYRSETINALSAEKRVLIFTTKSALDEKVLSPLQTVKKGFSFSLGNTVNREELIAELRDWEYEHVDVCNAPRTFSVRGGLLDIYLLYSAYPVRIEFFGNEVESMRLFNPLSQRRIKDIPSVEILPPPGKKSVPDPVSFRQRFPGPAEFMAQASGASISLRGPSLPTWTFNPLKNLTLNWIQNHADEFRLMQDSRKTLIVFVETESQIISLKPKLPSSTVFVLGSLDLSFDVPELGLLGLSAARLYNRSFSIKTRWDIESTRQQQKIDSIADLEWGDFLVHQDYGVGRFRGLEILDSGFAQQECIRIEYNDNGVVYVPIEKFNRVHKLMPSGDKEPTLSTLGTARWQQQKRRVSAVTTQAVQEIIDAYRARQRPREFSYDPIDELYDALVASFPFDETEDQRTAIHDVMDDMDHSQPMDRLVCGDVGFGKTEVALRAALRTIASGKKVLMLTPTTILADQHFISTRSRMEPLGVRIELLSRFRTPKQQSEILEQMMSDKLDMVIGTHRLLSTDVHFPGLGLLIIDEEHRFGVRHKEKLRRLKLAVDVLTLTATPIPRTLQQSLTGIRDISKIDTPPKTRKPIQTEVTYFNWDLVQRRIEFELSRSGQVYFLHNDILSLPFIAEKIQSLFPKAEIAIAHGQMKSRDLEKIMISFFDGDVDVLICTTIIESGLDVSNANTIIINEAHRFGLAQLYQIRGRVGRGYRQAFCYLMIPKGRVLGQQAYQRLKAIEQYTTLGSGYDIARKDLEIRGAGNLFGYKQSGHIAAVGFDLYCKLLQQAVDEALGQTTEKRAPKVIFKDDAFLSEAWVFLVQDRLYFYQRLSLAQTLEEIVDVEAELRDRFGPLPEEAQRLIHASEVRVVLSGSPVSRVMISGSELSVDLDGLGSFNSLDLLLSKITGFLLNASVPYQFIQGKGDVFSVNIHVVSEDSGVDLAKQFAQLFSSSKTE